MEVNHNQCWFLDCCTYGGSCTDECSDLKHFNYLCIHSKLPKRLWFPPQLGPTTKSDENSFELLADYKNNIQSHVKHGDNLYIYSENTGNGKTTWAAKMLLNYFDKLLPYFYGQNAGMFISVPSFILDGKLQFSNQHSTFTADLEQLRGASLVIWDDICSTDYTQFDYTILLSVIDERINNGLANIFTSNITPEKLSAITGTKVFSRVINTSTLVKFNGKDMRGAIND